MDQINISKILLLSGATRDREEEAVSWMTYQVFDLGFLVDHAVRHLAFCMGERVFFFNSFPPNRPYFFPAILGLRGGFNKKMEVVNEHTCGSSL